MSVNYYFGMLAKKVAQSNKQLKKRKSKYDYFQKF